MGGRSRLAGLSGEEDTYGDVDGEIGCLGARQVACTTPNTSVGYGGLRLARLGAWRDATEWEGKIGGGLARRGAALRARKSQEAWGLVDATTRTRARATRAL